MKTAGFVLRQPVPEYPGKDGVLVAVEFAPGQSRTEPAKLLVFFVADQNVPLVLPPQH